MILGGIRMVECHCRKCRVDRIVILALFLYG